MQIITSIAQLRAAIKQYKLAGDTIGFVPTMGNLHAGHLDLVSRASKKADRKVVSIFVNPAQFERQDDLDKYPRTMEEDLAKLEALEVDLVFSPQPKEMYPHGGLITQVDIPEMSCLLEGSSRPGHFRGVTTVVCKLFNIVQPDIAVFGQKDFQQLMLIRQMVADLDMPLEIIAAPTMRESDGLAMSSRNNRLTEDQRQLAPALQGVLRQLESSLKAGRKDFSDLQNKAMTELSGLGFKPDYIEVRNAKDLSPATELDQDLVILAAAYLGDIRLIDNIHCD